MRSKKHQRNTARQVTLIASLTFASIAAAAPDPIVPAGDDIFGHPNIAPGPYPRTLTSATWFNSLPANTVNGRFGSNAIRNNAILSGPLKWTTGNMNEGDFDISISPGAPADPRSFPSFSGYDAFRENDFPSLSCNPLPTSIPLPASQWPDTENWGRLRLNNTRAFAPVNFAWGTHPAVGVMIATVANLGRDNQNFDRNDRVTPLGVTYGHAHVTDDGGDATGRAYNPLNGTFQGTSLYVSLFVIGDRPGDQDELVTDFSAAYFPYEEGWLGGFYDPGSQSWRLRDSQLCVTPALASSANSVVTHLDFGIAARYHIELPDLTPNDGLLFAQNCNDTNETQICGVLPTSTGWDIAERFDGVIDPLGVFSFAPDDGSARFAFVFVPWSARNLVAAQVDGSGNTVHSAGNFTLVRASQGEYHLTIPGKNRNTGSLLVHGAGACPGNADVPDNTFFNYSFDSEFGYFVIRSRVLDSGSNAWGESYPPRDSGFYFMYVDYTTPPTILPCGADFNGDNVVDFFDYLDFVQAFASNDPSADFNNDSVIDFFDYLDFVQAFASGC